MGKNRPTKKLLLDKTRMRALGQPELEAAAGATGGGPRHTGPCENGSSTVGNSHAVCTYSCNTCYPCEVIR